MSVLAVVLYAISTPVYKMVLQLVLPMKGAHSSIWEQASG